MVMQLPNGSVIDERYEVIDYVGGGGMGAIYKARERELNRIVALKIMHATNADDEDRARFEREGQVMSEMSHRNIALIYRMSLNSAIPYIAMEFLEGRSLRDVLVHSQSGLGVSRSLAIVKQVASALSQAHARGVVHRDVKPENIILLQQPEADFVKVVDFGLARLTGESLNVEQKLTQTGFLVGSVSYMSPEQCLGGKADERSDVYSLGCVLYECIAGVPPFEADNPIGMLHMHAHETADRMSKKCGRPVPELVEQIVAKAISKDPQSRYSTMHSFFDDLALVSEGKQTGVIAESIPKAPLLPRSSLIPCLLLSLLFVVTLGATVVYFNDGMLLSVCRWACGIPPASDRIAVTLKAARWLSSQKRDICADELLSEVASSGKFIPRKELDELWGGSRLNSKNADEDMLVSEAFAMRAMYAESLGRPKDAMSFMSASLQYCLAGSCKSTGRHPALDKIASLSASLFSRTTDVRLPNEDNSSIVTTAISLSRSIDYIAFEDLLTQLERRKLNFVALGQIRNSLGETKLRQGKVEEALVIAEHMLRDCPRNAEWVAREGYRMRCKALMQKGDFDAAMDSMKRAMECSVYFKDAKLSDCELAITCLAHLSRFDEAEKLGRSAISTNVDRLREPRERQDYYNQSRCKVLRQLIRLCILKRDRKSAAEFLEQLKLAISYKDTDMTSVSERIWDDVIDVGNAMFDLRLAEEIDSMIQWTGKMVATGKVANKPTLVLVFRAWSYFLKGKPVSAGRIADSILATEHSSPTLRDAAWDLRVYVLIAGGDLEEAQNALSLMRKSLSQVPAVQSTASHRRQRLGMLKNLEAAISFASGDKETSLKCAGESLQTLDILDRGWLEAAAIVYDEPELMLVHSQNKVERSAVK